MSANLIHENTLYSEPIAHIGGFPITNALLNSWLALILVVILAIAIRKKIKLVPRGIQNFMESVLELFFDVFDNVTGSRAKTLKFAPFVLSFFFLILINNWLGILPGIGSIGQIVQSGGNQYFIPYFRSGMADLNATLALAIIGVVASHILGVIALGLWKHFNKFINIKALLEIPKKIKEDSMVIIINPIKFFVGIIEIVGEVAKVVSLSFRLFGNVFAGEVLLASMAAILAFGLPVPFMFLEVLVGLIQALIFTILVLTYLSMNTTAEEH